MLVHVTPNLDQFPRPYAICRETTFDPNYRFSGADRPGPEYSFFQYTLSGRGIFEANGVAHQLTPGRGFLCYVQDPAYVYRLPDDANEPWEFIYVQMTGEPTRVMVEALVKRFGYVYDLPANRGSMRRLRDWYDEGHNVLSATDAMAAVTDLFAELLVSRETAYGTENESHVIRRALKIIDQRLDQPLSATRLADELKISREYLSRLFRRHLSKSPYRYVLDYKITHAALRLRQSDESVKEIAYAYGFSSPEQFCKAFRKCKGVPPSRYRNA